MKKLVFITAVSLSLIVSASIYASNPTVKKCPSISELQRIKFDSALEINGKWRAGIIHNNFDTDVAWSFFVEGIAAKDANRAINIGTEAVKSLGFVEGPIHVNKQGYEWDYCEYTTAIGYESFAYTPAFDDGGINYH